MEVGNIPRFEQFENIVPKHIEEIKKIQKLELMDEEVKNRNIDNPEMIKELSSIRKIKSKEQSAPKTVEYNISNVNFGYNAETKDFYVKVNRSDYMAQYPTDEMMKLKAYLMHLTQDSIA
ncbi:MAG: hypothetical protein WC141_07635 [Arcobacteraceae bacterium]